MKTLRDLRREVALNSLISREIHESEFIELMQIYERKGWMRHNVRGILISFGEYIL